MRQIHLSKASKNKLLRQSIWYMANKGESFVRTMMKNINKDIITLSEMPQIGKPCYIADGIQMYKMPSKKKAVIIYSFTHTDLYIADILFANTNTPKI